MSMTRRQAIDWLWALSVHVEDNTFGDTPEKTNDQRWGIFNQTQEALEVLGVNDEEMSPEE